MDNHSTLLTSKYRFQRLLALCAGLMVFLPSSVTSQVFKTESRIESFEAKAAESSVFVNFPFTNIGPTIMSGRVTDIEGNPNDPNEFFVAYASGGVWYIQNGGMSMRPVFDGQSTLTIGDIAVRWEEPLEIWVGTGEVNSSRSSYAGTGVYKSTDTGQSWEHLGLIESHHIGRIVLDPENPEIAYVAVLGHLYSTNPERGVYMTRDGGQSWNKSLYVNDSAGAVDLVLSSDGTLFAATWERIRHAWNFDGDGVGSGIYRSDDKGETWVNISYSESGFPDGPNCGRIGLAYDSQLERLYALVDNQEKVIDPEREHPLLTYKVLEESILRELLEVENEDWDLFLETFSFPEDLNGEKIKKKLEKGDVSIEDLIRYIGINANEDLFDTEVKGAELYLFESDQWVKTHEESLEGVYYTYGYYFGQVRTDPFDAGKLYILGVPLIYSDDTGRTFKRFNGGHIHADHHDLWLNPSKKGHMISGNDGGLNISFDGGKEWSKANPIPVGQFYTVAVDSRRDDYHVYGGLQDNGVWMGSANYEFSKDWLASGKYPYQSIMGGDGMQVSIDPRDNNTVYTGYQFGNYYRINLASEDYSYITPQHELGESAYRWNWQTPIHLSVHHPDFLYMGSQHFHRSMDQGESFERMSEDLTAGGKPGNVPYGTLTTIDESPLQFGLIYTGSDDGMLYRTDDLGNNWTDISGGLQEGLWVSRVEASNFNPDRLYVALNGYRNDDFAAYLYKSEDRGKTYEFIGGDLPDEPVNVVLEDPVNESILYVGTDHGLYISMDMGATFERSNFKSFPSVAVHDLAYASNAGHLIIGTHGRSIYRADVSFLQDLPALQDSLSQPGLVAVFEDTIQFSENWGSRRWDWTVYDGPTLEFWLLNEIGDELSVTLFDERGKAMNSWELEEVSGMSKPSIELEIDTEMYRGSKKAPLPEASENGDVYPAEGKYFLRFTSGDVSLDYPVYIVGKGKADQSGPNPDKKP